MILRLLFLAFGFSAAPVPTGAQTDQTSNMAADVPRSAVDGGPRRWTPVQRGKAINLYRKPSATAEHTVFTTENAFENLGCARQDDLVWCKVRALHGGPRLYALADTLRPAPGPDGTIAIGPDDSRDRLQRGDIDASGEIPCAQEKGQPLGVCRADVSWGTGGDATVRATFANGFARQLTFANGVFIAGNPTMSGVGTDTDWQLLDGVHTIRIDDQRFILPDALVFGR